MQLRLDPSPGNHLFAVTYLNVTNTLILLPTSSAVHLSSSSLVVLETGILVCSMLCVNIDKCVIVPSRAGNDHKMSRVKAGEGKV